MYVSRRRRRHAMGLAAILGVGAIALAGASPALGHDAARGPDAPLGHRRRRRPQLRRDGRERRLQPGRRPAPDGLVGHDTGESEIFARLLDGAGTPARRRSSASRTWARRRGRVRGREPDVAYNARRNEYLVVWRGDDSAGPLVERRVRDLRPAPHRRGRRGGRQRPADLRHGAERRHRPSQPRTPPSPTTRSATSTWSPGRGTTTRGRSSTARTRSSSSASARRAPRWGPTTGASRTWARTATRPSRPTTRPSPTTRAATGTWWPGRATTTPGRSSRARTRSTSSASARGRPDGRQRPARLGHGADRRPGLRGQRPQPRLQPGRRRVPGRLGGGRRHGALTEEGVRDLRPASRGHRRPSRRRRPADLPDGPRWRRRLRRGPPARGGQRPGERVPGGPGRPRTTRGRWSTRRTRSTRSASARTGPRREATTCASRRWARTGTIAATASPPRSPSPRGPTST